MAHSAEDITGFILQRDYNARTPVHHSDVKHGFVINFPALPEIDIGELEGKVCEIIQQNLPITVRATTRSPSGDHVFPCTGTRTHVKSTGEIQNFRLVQKFSYLRSSRSTC